MARMRWHYERGMDDATRAALQLGDDECQVHFSLDPALTDEQVREYIAGLREILGDRAVIHWSPP